MSTYPLRMAAVTVAVMACLAVVLAVPGSPARAAVAGHVAPSVVLVNQPPARICVGRKIQVGVWYQKTGGSRRYRVDVYNPKGKRVFHRHGRAPSSHWRFWHVRAAMAGRYRVVYWGHFKDPRTWTPYRARTIAHRC